MNRVIDMLFSRYILYIGWWLRCNTSNDRSLFFILEGVKVSRKNMYLVLLQSTMPRSSVKHKCPQCHRSYAHLHTLRIHEATHRGRYPYWCKVCGKGFLATTNLRGHMVQHTGVSEFNCDICGRQFRYLQNIKKHLEQHSKESSRDRPLKWGTWDDLLGWNIFAFSLSFRITKLCILYL